MIVDTHSHLNFQAFKKDLPEVIKRTKAAGIVCINVGTKYETSKSAVQIAEENDGMYAAVGLHPIYAAAEFVKTKTDPDEGEFLITEQEFDYEKYKELALSKKVVAIGEIGLDYYYKPKTTATKSFLFIISLFYKNDFGCQAVYPHGGALPRSRTFVGQAPQAFLRVTFDFHLKRLDRGLKRVCSRDYKMRRILLAQS